MGFAPLFLQRTPWHATCNVNGMAQLVPARSSSEHTVAPTAPSLRPTAQLGPVAPQQQRFVIYAADPSMIARRVSVLREALRRNNGVLLHLDWSYDDVRQEHAAVVHYRVPVVAAHEPTRGRVLVG